LPPTRRRADCADFRTRTRDTRHSVERNRRATESGNRFPTAVSFLDAVIDQFADAIGHMAEALGAWWAMPVAFAAGGISYWALRRMRAL
jgi:hypothetical protein